MKKIILSIFLMANFCLHGNAQNNLIQMNDSKILMGQGNINDASTYKIRIESLSGDPSLIWVQNHITTGPGTTLSAYKALGTSGSSIALWGSAYNATAQTNTGAYGLYISAGNGRSGDNCGVFSFLRGDNGGAAIYGASEQDISHTISGGKFAGYFNGRVYASERLGVGNYSPSYTLDVSGTIRCTTLTQTSDMRTKTNITNLGSTTDQVSQLRAVKYQMKPNDMEMMSKGKALTDTARTSTDNLKYLSLEEKKDTDRDHIGFIAQEFKTIFPELVYEDEKGMLSIDYLSLIPILVETIQQLNKRLEAVENKKPGIVNEIK